MASQAIMFFSAGNETTSLALSFVLSEIASNKEIQNSLREEIVETFRKHGDFTYDALQEMKYLDMVWKGLCVIYNIFSKFQSDNVLQKGLGNTHLQYF